MIYITYDLLGGHGQLGNQMFQYALLVGIKNKIPNCQIVINPEVKKNSYLFDFFELKSPLIEKFTIDDLYSEPHFHFDSNVFKIDKNTNFRGYFQTEKYFKHCKNEIHNEFTFKPNIVKEVEQFLSPFQNKKLVSVHVRRGDYLINPLSHPLPTLTYYYNAMEMLDDGNTVFICTSNDLEWCKNNIIKDNIVFTCNSIEYDMCLLSKCDDHIIANSSYSWWSSWLGVSPTKKVIAPFPWFGPKESHLDTKDLYRNEFIVL